MKQIMQKIMQQTIKPSKINHSTANQFKMRQKNLTTSISVLSLSLLLAACGGGNSNNSSDNSAETIPMNNIANPLVNTPQTYALTDLSASAASSQKITYKMLGVNGSEVQATALVFTPKTTAPAGGWPIVVWAHGTTGVADKCAPSRFPLASDQQTLFTQLLNAGYVVVAPDYEGMNGFEVDNELHPFLNLKSEGYAITDAVVATRNLLSGQTSNQWLVVGHSQGGQAALGAAQYASRAQLSYKGTVAVAPASNLRVILASGESQALGKTPDVQIPIYAGLDSFTALITAGIRNALPNFAYSSVFQGQTLAVASQFAENECLFAIPPSPLSLPNALGQSMQSYVVTNNGSLQGYGRTAPNFISNSTVANFVDHTSQPLTRNVSTPVIIYQGQADTTVPFNATEKLVRDGRSTGNNITYNVNATWTHASALSININNNNILNDVKTLMPTVVTAPVPVAN